MIFSREYLRVFLPLAICFAVYHLTFVPWINHKTRSTERKWSAAVLPDTDEWWDLFFREDSWQRKSPQVLTTESGTLLYRERVEISETRWHIKPLTILIPQRSSGASKRAILISNPEGAEIQFQRRPDWTSEPPPVETGRLLGQIQIYSPPVDGSSNSGLLIETSEVRIEKRQIWTDKGIKMQMGDSLIEGHFLTINLEQKLLSTEEPISPGVKTPFDGLESMELTYVDRVRIGLKNGGLWPSDKIKDAAQRPAHAVLKCGGRFTFHFQQSEAMLRGGVHMEHRVEGLPIDTFDCEDLTMQIGFHEDPIQPAPSAHEPRKPSPWKLDKLTAVGALGKTPSDRSQWMKLLAPGMQVEALGQRLFIDFLNGEIHLSNTLPLTVAQESSPVYLRRENMQVWAPEILFGNPKLFQKSNTGTATPIDRLGTVVASGPGVAQMESDRETWKLSWGQKLLVRPSDQLDVVSIVGSANINNSSQGTFLADKLDLWLRPTDENRIASLQRFYLNEPVPKWLPEAMAASGDVRVESPQLIAHVQKMNLKFRYPESDADAALASSTTSPQSPTPQSPTTQLPAAFPYPSTGVGGTSNPNVVRQPTTVASGAAASVQDAVPPPRPDPLSVAAESLDMVVKSVGKKSSIEGLSLEGPFEMRKEMLDSASPWPFTASGKQLRMIEVARDTMDVHIVGEPARITVGRGEVVAPELKLTQSENVFHIDHPGELVIPPEAIPLQPETQGAATLVSTPGLGLPNTLSNSSPSPLSNPSLVKWLEPPRLRWGERMTFDGKIARFGGGVDLTCRIQSAADSISHIFVQSRSLSVEMAHAIPLQPTSARGGPKAQVQIIRFEEDVDIKMAETDLAMQRRSAEHMRLPRLDIYAPTQTFLGYGPGEVWSRRYAMTASLPAFGTPTTTTSSKTNTLQCLHLSFTGRLEGDLRTKKASFFDRIDALMGPIASWEDQVNVHRAERLGKNQTRLSADQLNLFDGGELSYNQISPSNRGEAPPPAWELEAVSRVQVESITDKGRVTMEGHSLKYAAKEDTVIVSGSPRQAALFTLYPNDGSPSDFIDTRLPNISIQLKTGAIKGNISRIEGPLPPNMQRAGTPGSTTPGSSMNGQATTGFPNNPLLPDPRGGGGATRPR
ncbi:hypothetical protein SH467x_002667 [Pirellulaceae bacterium SH467]